MRTLLSPLLCLACLGSAPAAPGTSPSTMQTPHVFSQTISRTLQAHYLLFLPRDYARTEDTSWPLILFLHGAGERGNDLQKVTVHGPPKRVQQQPEFPFIVVSPQCPEGHQWSDEVLIHLLDEILSAYRVDRARVYLTGLSMGGYGTWSLGLNHPERFAAIAPICGGGNTIDVLLATREKGAAIHSLGIWAFHGAKDPVVKPEESQRMVDLLKRTGHHDVKLTLYPDADHDSWTRTYDNPELYEWFLKHRR